MPSYLLFLLVVLVTFAALPVGYVAPLGVQNTVNANPSMLGNVRANADQPVKLTPGVPTSGFWNRTHGTGAIPDVIPEGAAANVIVAGALPTSFSWTGHFGGTNYMTPVKNQGCQDCWAFATIGDMEAQYQIQTSNPATGIDLSEQNLLQCSGGSCSGGQVGEALDFLRNSGTPDENCNPYNAADHPCGTGRCLDYLSRTYYVTSWNWIATDAANMKAALTYGPVMVVMPIFDDFPWSDPSYWYYHFYSHQYQLLEHSEWHAVVLVGWNDQGPGTQDDYWIVRNSWGTGGGDIWRGYGGYFYITQDPTTGFFAIPFQQREAAVIWGVAAPYYAVTFYTDPTSGSITADGVTKTNGATGTYNPASRVHVVASSPSGYAFSYWETSGVSVDSVSSQDTYMTVSGNGWLRAHFRPLKPWASIVSPSGWLRDTGTLTATAGDPDGYVVRVRFLWTPDITNGPFWIIGDDTNGANGWSIIWDCGGPGNNDPSVWVAAVALDNSGLESDWSWSNQFGVDQTPPSPPSLSSPSSGSGTTNPTPTFAWVAASDSLSGVASYTFQIDTSTSFNSGNLRTVTGITSTTYVPGAPLGIGTWYWRVGAVDNAGNQGSFSPYWSITIQNQCTITVNTSPPGLDSPQGGGTYTSGQQITISVSDVNGYTFIKWQRDSADWTTQKSFQYAVDASHTFTAIFTQGYALTVSVVGTGTVNLDNPGPYHYGDVVHLTAVAGTGWSLASPLWSGDLSGDANPGTITIDGNKIVTAHFTQNVYVLTVTVSPVGGGSVDQSPGPPYHLDDVVTLTATPAAGFSFKGWSDDASGTNPSVQVTMTGDKHVTAIFESSAVVQTEVLVKSRTIFGVDSSGVNVRVEWRELGHRRRMTVVTSYSLGEVRGLYKFTAPKSTYVNGARQYFERWEDESGGVLTTSKSLTYDVQSGKTFYAVYGPKQYKLTLYVRDTTTRKPVVGATVEVTGDYPNQHFILTTNSRGKVIFRGVYGGQWLTVTITKDGYQPFSVRIFFTRNTTYRTYLIPA